MMILAMGKVSRVAGFTVTLLFAFILAFAQSAYSEDRLVVKDAQGDGRFVVTDSGNVLINTDTTDQPDWVKLFAENEGEMVALAFDSIANKYAGTGLLLRFARGTKASRSAIQNGDRLGYMLFGGYDGTQFLNTAGITALVEGNVSAGNIPSRFAFETGASGFPRLERLVITSTGNIGIGVTNPTRLLSMAGGAYCNGTNWVNASSRVLKENIQDLDKNEAMSAVMMLNPVKFNYKNSPTEESLGFIAEDVPSIVATNDRKGMDSMDVVALLTKVVQEQQKSIVELTAKVALLEKGSK